MTRHLRVVGRRADGYHLLETEMLALDLADVLEIRPLDTPTAHPPPDVAGLEVLDEVAWSGAPPGGEGGEGGVSPLGVPAGPDNLVARALAAAGRRAAVRLRKRIPTGAGLGGGSADAAAVLRWAGVTDLDVAARLGADVPFCLAGGGRALVRGIGDELEPLPVEPAAFLLVTPPFGVSTVAVYRAFDELGAGAGESERRNDLEHAALAVEPGLALWRDLLAEVSGHRPQLAGSGSTWFVELAPSARWDRLAREVGAALMTAGVRAAVAVARAVPPG